MTVPALVLALALAHLAHRLPEPSPEAEIAALAIVRQVPPGLALAIAQAETGNLRGRHRDRVISRGNVGRFQINATTWCRPLGYHSRPACLRALQDRHRNARAGVAILAQCLQRWRLDGLEAVAGHYNSGRVITPAGERYGRRVAEIMAQALRGRARTQ